MKPRTLRSALVAFVLFVLAAGYPLVGAAARFGVVLNGQSSLGFSYRQMGVNMSGSFQRFRAQVEFNSEKPADAKVSLDVELASIDTGSSEGNREVAGKKWFDTRNNPTAHFDSGSVKPAGNNRYEVIGLLSLKGRSGLVTAPTTVSVQGTNVVFDGSFILRRSDFGIGEGEWADTSVLADEVRVVFHIVAAPGK